MTAGNSGSWLVRKRGPPSTLILGMVLYAAGFVLAAGFMLESAGNPFFKLHLSDSAYYLDWAARMASGKGFGAEPYFVNPLYLFFLTLLNRFGLAEIGFIRTVQVVLASLIYPLVYFLGVRLFNARAGLMAAVVTLGYGPLIHASSELSPGWLDTVLVMALLWLASRGPSGFGLPAAGCAAGLLVLSRPNYILLAAAVAVGWAYRRGGIESRRRKIIQASLFAAAAAVVVFPVTARNFIVAKDLVLVSSHGGINFYIGNSPAAGGTFYAPPGFHEDPISINSRDARLLAEKETGKVLKPSDVSAFWFRKGLSFLAADPGAALRLYGRKLLLLAHAFEVPLNSDYYLFRERSWILRLMPVTFAVLLAGGAAGLIMSRGRGQELWPMKAFLIIHFLSVAAFFVSSRYRLPASPALAIMAGYGLDRLPGLWRGSRRAAASGLAAAAILITLLSLSYPFIDDIKGDSRASSFESLGIRYYEQGDTDEAERALRAAVAVRPAIKSPHWYLARIYERKGDTVKAYDEWMTAAKLYGPDDSWGRQAAVNARRLKY